MRRRRGGRRRARPLLPLPFGRDTEFVCIDTSGSFLLFGERFFRHPNHLRSCEARSRPRAGPGAWRIPFCAPSAVLRRGRCTASQSSIEHLVPLYRRAGVRRCSAGTSTTSSTAGAGRHPLLHHRRGGKSSQRHAERLARGGHDRVGGGGPLPARPPRRSARHGDSRWRGRSSTRGVEPRGRCRGRHHRDRSLSYRPDRVPRAVTGSGRKSSWPVVNRRFQESGAQEVVWSPCDFFSVRLRR